MPRPRPRLGELVLDFVEGLLAEVAVFEHFRLGLHGELAHGGDVGVVEAVGGADAEFDFVDAHIEQLLESGVFLAGLGRRLLEIHRILVVVDEDVKVVAQDGGRLEQGVLRGDATVRPDIEHQFVEIRHLADAGGFHRIFDAGDRRVDRIDGNDADGLVLALVFIASGETTANAHLEFAIEFHFLVQGADELVLVDDIIDMVGLDVSGGNDTFLLDLDRQDARFLLVVAEPDFLEVEHDFGDVFHHTREAGEFVLDARDTDGGDGGTLQGGEQDAAE